MNEIILICSDFYNSIHVKDIDAAKASLARAYEIHKEYGESEIMEVMIEAMEQELAHHLH